MSTHPLEIALRNTEALVELVARLHCPTPDPPRHIAIRYATSDELRSDLLTGELMAVRRGAPSRFNYGIYVGTMPDETGTWVVPTRAGPRRTTAPCAFAIGQNSSTTQTCS